MTLHKILKYVALVIGVLGLIFLGRVLAAGDDAIEASADVQNSVLEPMMWISYLVLAVVIALVAIFVIAGLFRGNIKNTIIGIVSFAVVVLVSYLLTSGTQITTNDGDILSASAVHWVGAGLVCFYILAALAILAMVFSGVKKLIS
ncbi:alkaline shock response membrane anchor protein AmaP [Zunongwangia pacifica]|uniref:Alkaline shock response membrane anchor protein AmaP n=1 Tax=Zunongwangia pacifica TaxID=2911062 RepID=A0A9X1ZPU2_9FLAO|nr:alkaline shock response membrane anchor protein AmaP [Zunongwangia pacifica]MCL6218757.1 alkaline shock response membrane anchor protein AmaP [Zunongwangia pacifica]